MLQITRVDALCLGQVEPGGIAPKTLNALITIQRGSKALPQSWLPVARLAVLGFLGLVYARVPLRAQAIQTDANVISVHASKYDLEIDRACGMVTLESPGHVRYTSFPLLAEAVPVSVPRISPILSWEVRAPAVNMTARDPNTHQVFLKAALQFEADAFEVRFGVRPEMPDPGYAAEIINGSWPWGLGLDTAFARSPLSLAGEKFRKGLGAHAYSRVTLTFKQPVKFRTLEAQVGVDDEVGKQGSVDFQVRADGRKVAESGVLRGGQKPRLLKGSIAGAKTIELEVTDAGDGDAGDDADWADAKLAAADGQAVYVSDLITRLQQGAKVFSTGDRGFDTAGWTEMFTPEPDNYYSKTSAMVDVRQDVDGERFYAPAPLNLSFRTPAGWFSIGLAQLPDATGFRFEHGHIFIPYHWTKMDLSKDESYWMVPLCFTFNRSEWDGIADYRSYLLANHYVSDVPIEEKAIPAWWMEPLICTWSEEAIDNAAQASPRFTSDWVKRYVLGQEKALGLTHFTVIIDDKWQRKYGDPRPDPARFGDLRELIDWLHGRGHKVVLWWRCWYGEPGSLPEARGLLDHRDVDATHPLFEKYAKDAVRIMLGDGAGEFNADGFKMDYTFDVRSPSTASYAQPSLGIGIREVYRYASVWYQEAKRIKKDCLITFSGPDPHFALFQDMTRINDAGRDPFVRQKRARVSAMAAPNLLIDGDGADMFVSLADYHHIVSSAYGTPALYNLTRFSDGPITDDMHRMTGEIFRLAAMKKPGHPVFKSYGNWQYIRAGKLIAESFEDGTALLVRPDGGRALVLSTKHQDLNVPIRNAVPLTVEAEGGNRVRFDRRPGGLVIPDAQRGTIYVIQLKGQ